MRPSYPPRYVPTLTEVVAHAPVSAAGVDTDALTAQVLKVVGPRVEQALQKAVQAHMEVQISNLLPELHQQLEVAVRAAIAQALEETLRK